METSSLHTRSLLPRLEEALADSPVVLIHGARQCGKTTLARQVGDASGYTYLTFDNDVQRASAEADPVGFVADFPEKVILDEIQRVPNLFTSIKASVDTNRKPGRFILTGSANVLLVPKLADSLAGRMEILRLHPFAQAELTGVESGFFTSLFKGQFKRGGQGARLGQQLAELVVSGGYPAALAREAAHRRMSWYRDYIDTLVQRDVRDIRRIQSLDALPRLLSVAAGQTARLLNTSDLAAPFHLSRPTIRDYMTLLERVFLLEELQPWYTNRLSRLIKTPKLHLCDTGVACALLRVNAEVLWADRALYGQMLETFVYQELRRQASWQENLIDFYHYRDKDGIEIDIVLESVGKVAGIEIKASATVSIEDFKALGRMKQSLGSRFAAGVVLYDGDVVAPFGEGMYAVPISTLWT